MMPGGTPMPPEEVAELLDEAEQVDRNASLAHAALEAEARASSAANAADGDIEETENRPSLVERLIDFLDGDDEEAAPAEA